MLLSALVFANGTGMGLDPGGFALWVGYGYFDSYEHGVRWAAARAA